MSNKDLTTKPISSYPTFRLGIILAGAVSAGAYTAGVMDYLLECLCEWDKLKEKNKEILKSVDGDWNKAKTMTEQGFRPDIPMHNVVIEILAGASAGGMTAGIVLSSLFKGINKEANGSSLLYDAWVKLKKGNEEKEGKEEKKVKEGKNAFIQMLKNDDLTFLTKEAIKSVSKNLN